MNGLVSCVASISQKEGLDFVIADGSWPSLRDFFKDLSEDNWLKNLSTHEFCEKLAEYYCEFNMIHPFREGNGRVQRLLFEHLALAAGYDLDWEDVQPNEWIQANIDGVAVNYEPMARIFKRIVTACE
ncbi:Fic/DOC family protein [Methylocucumis oryzae]|uniref:Fic/DOC family protein n=1 Tax=Methylocucumis oryzae TaxID=1632867 RepID=UPI000AD1BB8B|nr:Fic family protein [Methylocucumis oryzae]